MHPHTPSQSAFRVALRRAAHQLFDRPLVFDDPLAVPMLLPDYAHHLRRTPQRASSVALRAFLVARSRLAEDALRHAVAHGVAQYLILGAGLDTFALRNPYPGLSVFEADHPATQQWKQDLLRRAGIAPPRNGAYLPLDFEDPPLESSLTAGNFDLSSPAFVSCLGVIPYLSVPAFRSLAAFLGKLPAGSGVALDYRLPRSALCSREQLEHDSLSSRLAQSGEALQLFFTPKLLAAALSSFPLVQDLSAAELNARYFQHRSDHLLIRGQATRMATAWKQHA